MLFLYLLTIKTLKIVFYASKPVKKVFVEKRKFIFGSKVRQVSTMQFPADVCLTAGAGHSCCPLVVALPFCSGYQLLIFRSWESHFPSQVLCYGCLGFPFSSLLGFDQECGAVLATGMNVCGFASIEITPQSQV